MGAAHDAGGRDVSAAPPLSPDAREVMDSIWVRLLADQLGRLTGGALLESLGSVIDASRDYLCSHQREVVEVLAGLLARIGQDDKTADPVPILLAHRALDAMLAVHARARASSSP